MNARIAEGLGGAGTSINKDGRADGGRTGRPALEMVRKGGAEAGIHR